MERRYPLAAVLAALLAVGANAAEPALERVTRSGFAMDMPAWQVETDEDNGVDGRYVRVAGQLRLEVGWSAEAEPSVDTLDAAITALQASHGATLVERRVDRPAGQLRHYSLIRLGDAPWLAMTTFWCQAAGVVTTVTTAATERKQAEHLHSTVRPTFACPANVPRAVAKWPASDLPTEFGAFMDGAPLLAHRDGRWIIIGKLSPATIASMARDPGSARRALATYGAAMGLGTFQVQAEATEIRNLSGPATAWGLESPVAGRVGASAFSCTGDSHGYIAFAGDDQGASDTAALHALTARLGCPDLPLPSVLDRPSACDVGVTDFCDETPHM